MGIWEEIRRRVGSVLPEPMVNADFNKVNEGIILRSECLRNEFPAEDRDAGELLRGKIVAYFCCEKTVNIIDAVLCRKVFLSKLNEAHRERLVSVFVCKEEPTVAASTFYPCAPRSYYIPHKPDSNLPKIDEILKYARTESVEVGVVIVSEDGAFVGRGTGDKFKNMSKNEAKLYVLVDGSVSKFSPSL